MSSIPSAARLCAFLLIALAPSGWVTVSSRADEPDASSSKPVGRWRDASLEDYRKHLVALQGLTQACAKARNITSCDPTLVGPDDRIPMGASANAERRMVRYGWLRILFSRAEEPDKARQAPGARKPANPADRSDESEEQTRPEQATTSRLLEDAQTRLASDLEQAGSMPAPSPAHNQERDVMNQVLAGREFRDLKQPTTRDTALERFGNWLNRVFANMDKLRARSAWVGRALIWGFLLAVGTGLAIVLVRLERRWRIRLVPSSNRPAPEAASARDWQLWMNDARTAAAGGLWRDAIHFLYWASISRLESKRLWPADRARTPREYLALVAPEDPRRGTLAALTRSFERTWYGGREARESDYRAAEGLATELVSGGGGAGQSATAAQTVAAQGGAA
ncbi:MAG TPA: DUF4129 domain-containing protein [Terracidiphilus sp.]